MARAGAVPGIRPKRPLRENARRVVAVRLEEFMSWRENALGDEKNVEELHDMRIAAKRLRYALEMFEICFPDTKRLLKDLTQIQEDLGDIHDLDVLAVRLRGRLDALGRPLPEEAIAITAAAVDRTEQINKIRGLLYAHARSPHRLGLLALIGDQVVERGRRYEAFRLRWGNTKLDQFADEVRRAVGLVEDNEQHEQVNDTGSREGRVG